MSPAQDTDRPVGGPAGPAPGPGRSVRRPAVAGSFYPSDPSALRTIVGALVGGTPRAPGPADGLPLGILVPHAGLIYSGAVAAAAWQLLSGAAPTVVILGTNHSAPFAGIAAWTGDAWAIPGGEVPIDGALATAIIGLGAPFFDEGSVHAREHSIEVQLPLLAAVAPGARIVPLSVSTGTASAAIEAGGRLGRLLAGRRASGEPIVLAISTDMAHYPPAEVCAGITAALLPPILALDGVGLAAAEAAATGPGVSCGMCGIEPTIVGLAALRAAGATGGTVLATATSADAGGDHRRTVGYCAARFDG